MNKFPILQSGFISFKEDDLQTPVKYNDLVISNVLSKDYRSPSNRYFFSEDISKLYNRWCGDPTCLNEFETREELLKVTKSLFGTPSLFKWLRLQTEHADLGDLHNTFLLDTLEYLCGQPRKVEAVQWIRLLEKAIKSRAIPVKFDKFFDRELYHHEGILPGNLIDIIQLWTGKPRGFEDLLITMYIIFGNRPYITDVSENPRS